MAALTKCLRTKSGVACYVLVVLICLAVIVACIPLAIWLVNRTNERQENLGADNGGNGNKTPSSDEVIWPEVPDEEENTYRYASVACAEKNCSKIGVQMLAEGGSAVDAMIATSLCLGVTRTTSSGVGGGGFMNFYQRSTNQTFLLDYRETAPSAATADMYSDPSNITSLYGGGSIAVPGEISGTWLAHQKFGKLPWARLFEPSIALAEEGITLNEYVAGHVAKQYENLNDVFKEIFTNPETGKVKKAGETIFFPKMAQTYRRIAEEGVDTYYNGSLRDDIIADLEELDGSIITVEDLRSYQPEIRQPIQVTLRNGGYRMTSLPPPSGGIVLQYILRILDGYSLSEESVSALKKDIASTSTTYHRIVEAMKFAYAMRSNLGDPAFSDLSEFINNMTSTEFADQIRTKIMDDSTQDVSYYGLQLTDSRLTTGTSQISILAGNGDAVSTTTSVNFVFGSKRMGRRTGIVFNNLMDDFSVPDEPSWSDDAWVAPSNKANWIEPGKRPLSAMSPTIVTDENGDVVLVTGGSGGSKIITAAAMTSINNLWLGMGLTEAVSRPRLHHQLLPEQILVEDGFPQEYQDELKKKNHKLTGNSFLPVSDSVGRSDGLVFGVGDPRREGASDGF
ncbi:scoloptoxin SSD14-like isoform X2 [Watersipora subatra]|uniref:scoloptoxin SSD14-like isoform X2 n=1 Tax=Watersipora subatra TaxID=2589382 RepID=UPI00355C7547